MQESFRARQDLDKGPEIDDLLDRPVVDLADLRVLGQPFHHRHGPRGGFRVAGGDGHGPVILHIDLHARLRHDLADILPAGADHVADLLGPHLHGGDPRRIDGDVRLRRRKRLAQLPDDEQPPLAGLAERLAQDLPGEVVDLDVHLQRGDALLRPADLEVHVAGMVLVSEDVGENDHPVPLFQQPHRDPGHRIPDRDPGIHQR